MRAKFILILSVMPLLSLAQTQASNPTAQQTPVTAAATGDMVQQMRGLMTQNCAKAAREKSSGSVSDAQIQSYCGCISERLVTDQASLIKLGELGLRMMRKDPGAEEAMAQMAGPAALMCATKLQGK